MDEVYVKMKQFKMKLKDVGNRLKLFGVIRKEQFLQFSAFTDHQKTKDWFESPHVTVVL